MIDQKSENEDITRAVLFFAAEFAEWTTGQTLSVYGGRK